MTQSESRWLDLAAYRDAVVWLDVKEVSSTSITIATETAPAKEESLFAAMATSPAAITAAVYVSPILQDVQTGAANAASLARWVRWKITFSGTVDITFRIWIAANKPGRAMLNRSAASTRR